MRLRYPAFAMVLAAVAAPAFAQENPVPAGTDWEALLLKAVEDNGCKMNEDEAPGKLLPLGFGEDWTVHVLDELIADGLVVLDHDTQTVIAKSEACQ